MMPFTFSSTSSARLCGAADVLEIYKEEFRAVHAVAVCSHLSCTRN
jgi:hypothetical protein